MSSSTPNIGLTLPVGGENVSRQIINENNTKIDNYAGTLNSKLLKPITVTVDPITNASGSYNHTTSGVTLITEDMKAIDIEVGTPETFKAPVTVTTGNHTVNVSCPSVSGSSTITITFIHTEPVEGGQNVPAQITSTEFDILAGRIGNLSSLHTSVKTDTVSAVNELSEQIGTLNSKMTSTYGTIAFEDVSSSVTMHNTYRTYWKYGNIVILYMEMDVSENISSWSHLFTINNSNLLPGTSGVRCETAGRIYYLSNTGGVDTQGALSAGHYSLHWVYIIGA